MRDVKLSSIRYKFIVNSIDEYAVVYWLDPKDMSLSISKNGEFFWQRKLKEKEVQTLKSARMILDSVIRLKKKAA